MVILKWPKPVRGVKFLVAMLAYATLAANVCFVSWTRRVLFMIVAVVVPIIANGFRAYSTIHISYVSGNNHFAESVDHIIYGWFFFGFVMVVVMGLSWKFFDRKVDAPWLSDTLKSGGIARTASWRIPLAVIALALLPMGWQTANPNYSIRTAQ